ncbi:MAG: tetratricopeptide repeat protein [Bacteroidota bacterium]
MDWSRIQDLFDAALEQPAHERLAFLEAQCGKDTALLREVTSLLDAESDTEAGTFLDRPIASVQDALTTNPLRVGQTIGRYELTDLIGKGGMGRVYRAKRVDGQYDQEVAVKVLMRELAAGEGRGRFLVERQILAQLQHPNVARLLDGGVTDDGIPYYVMEFVDGKPINQYADEKRLTVQQRLELFVDVCKAVEYAHQNLIVHRDLKPSNILVTDDGTVKLLDFGIAKLLNQSRAAYAMPPTRKGLWVMTPEYAAPEQIRRTSITTATDVYALGVILYELLTGHRPYRVTATQIPSEIERLVCEHDPLRPSEAVHRIDELTFAGEAVTVTPESVAIQRSTRPERLIRTLTGDIDTIVQMALRKEPSRRYRSAEGLKQDIERYFASLPIRAREDSALYRSGKFIQRHKVGVGAFSLILGLVALLVGVLIQSNAESRAYVDEVAAERDRAMLGEQKATQIRDFLMEVFEVSNVGQLRGESVTAAELLEQGAERIETSLRDQPEVQAEMLSVLGRVHRRLGEFEKAQPYFERAFTIRRSRFEGDQLDLVSSLSDLGQLYIDQGRYAEAAVQLDSALSMQRRLTGDSRGETLPVLVDLSVARARAGQPAEAESLFTRLFEREPNLINVRLGSVADAETAWADLLIERGAFDTAEGLLEHALALQTDLYGTLHTSVARTMHYMARLDAAQGRYAEAETGYREALEVYHTVRGENHVSTYPLLHDLALAQLARNEFAAAERTLSDLIDRHRMRFGNTHPEVPLLVNDLSLVRSRQGRIEEAETLLRDALTAQRDAMGTQHAFYARTLSNLATTRMLRGDYGEAELHLQAALSVFRRVYGEGHPVTVEAAARLGRLYTASGVLTEATEVLTRVYERRRNQYGRSHPLVGESANDLAALALATGNAERADSLALDTFTSFENRLPSAHPLLGASLRLRAEAAHARGNLEPAATLFTDALGRLEGVYGQENVHLVPAIIGYGSVLTDLDRAALAGQTFQRASQLSRDKFEPGTPALANLLLPYGRLLMQTNRLSDAAPLLDEALATYTTLDPESPRRHMAASALGALFTRANRLDDAAGLLQDAYNALALWQPEHYETLRAQRNLAALYEASGEE